MISDRSSLVLPLLAVAAVMFACGEDAAPAAAGPQAGAGGSGVAGESSAAGSAGQAGADSVGGEGGGAQGGAAGANGGAAGGGTGPRTTSAMCGSVAILGQQGDDTSDVCTECANTSCCAEAAACGALEDCGAYRACVRPCKTSECSRACEASYPAGISRSNAFAGCRNAKCTLQCQEMRCLGKVSAAAPTAPTLAITLVPTDFQTGKPVPKVTIKQCKRTDLACETPVATEVTNALGEATFAAVAAGPAGLDDYFEMTEAAYEPTLWFNVASGTSEVADGARLPPRFISKQTWSLLTGVISTTPVAERGHVAYLVSACSGGNAAGVSVSADAADAQTTTTYIDNGLPSMTAAETDSSGAGAFLNLPPGPVVLVGKLVSSGAAIGTTRVFTRAGFISTTNVVPGP